MKKSCDSDTRSAYIEQIEAGRKRLSEVAKELGITEDTFYRWQKQLRDYSDRDFSRRVQKVPHHPKYDQD